MKVLLLLFLLQGNPIQGIEFDPQKIESMFHSMMSEIKQLSTKVQTLENQVTQDQLEIKHLSQKVKALESKVIEEPLEDRVEKLEQ